MWLVVPTVSELHVDCLLLLNPSALVWLARSFLQFSAVSRSLPQHNVHNLHVMQHMLAYHDIKLSLVVDKTEEMRSPRKNTATTRLCEGSTQRLVWRSVAHT